jgi:hypothetical protein
MSVDNRFFFLLFIVLQLLEYFRLVYCNCLLWTIFTTINLHYVIEVKKIKLPNMEKSVIFYEWYIYVGHESVVLLSIESTLQSAIK